MEFFNRAKVVRLKGHLGKYLVADDDEQTVRQSRNGSSKKARWMVELVQGNPHLIRLRSCNDKYLSASDDAFLLGMTGKRVLQASLNSAIDGSIEWEPIKEGDQVKLRTKGGKFLRANGATPPWRNSVTHDLPNRTATQEWVLWDVDVIDISELESQSLQSYPSILSSYSSFADDDFADYSNIRRSVSAIPTCPSISSDHSSFSSSRQSGMEFFDRAKAVRLQSHLGKYLLADEDERTVRQSRNGSSHRARWTVELVNEKNNVIRLKSCYGLYLTATEQPFLLGMTGKKVLQTLSTKNMDGSIEWEPIKEGFHVKLRTSEGKYLRANGATPPWRNSITHDVPNRTATQDWVMWGVEVVDITISDTNESVSSCLSLRRVLILCSMIMLLLPILDHQIS
ncbi:putative pentatricopeptide repeat-containing protein, chloroplastic-like [Capsicum annuum]|nr:putative pentatricopeptide repeat-containing protein, chloroplastic-like [Capsicum annuum]